MDSYFSAGIVETRRGTGCSDFGLQGQGLLSPFSVQNTVPAGVLAISFMEYSCFVVLGHIHHRGGKLPVLFSEF